MKPGFLSRNAFTLGRGRWKMTAPIALVVLMLVAFSTPFALRGARYSLATMKNDVKDWLPSDFKETKELDWFRDHFLGETFVVMSWPGASEDDQRYRLLMAKLEDETADDPEDLSKLPVAKREDIEARQIGDKYHLFLTEDPKLNWGGENEKWLLGKDPETDSDAHFYIKPNGEIYQWNGGEDFISWLGRSSSRLMGNVSIDGELIGKVGQESTPAGEVNRFYANPRKISARHFKTVMSGPKLQDQLAEEGGALWPRGDFAQENRPIIARRQALQRLTGTLFGDPKYLEFAWTLQDFKRIVPEASRAKYPKGWEDTVKNYLSKTIQDEYAGERQKLVSAKRSEKREVWNGLFDELGVEPPARQTAILVTLTDIAKDDLRKTVGQPGLGKPRGKLLDLADECSIEITELKLGGPAIDNVAIDEEGERTLMRLVGFSAIVGIGLSLFFFRSIMVTTMIFFVGGVSAVAGLGMVWWTGSTVDAVLLSMPAVVYVLGLSGAVHMVNYYFEAQQTHGEFGAPERAFNHAIWPCSLAAFTTALGLISLCVSNLTPIKKFGFFSAVGVLLTVVLLFTYLPAALTLFPVRRSSPKNKREPSLLERSIEAFWEAVGGFIVRNWGLVAVTCVLVFATFGYGLFRINTSIQLLKLFDEDAKIIADYQWLEENLGKLVPMEVVIAVDSDLLMPPQDSKAAKKISRNEADRKLNFLERLELEAQVRRAVEGSFSDDIVGHGLSVDTFAPPLPPPGGGALTGTRPVTNYKLEQSRQEYLDTDYLRMDNETGEELWRVSLRLGALNDVDYGKFVKDIQQTVEPVMNAYQTRGEILKAIEAKHGEDAWQSGTLLILGVNSEDVDASREALGDEEDKVGKIDQTRLFVRSLGHALTNRGFTSNGRRVVRWHDPDNPNQKVSEFFPDDKSWADYVSQFDAVVLVEDRPEYKSAVLAKQGNLIDATNHEFVPGDESLDAKDRNLAIHATYTGLVPIVYKAQRTLLESLIESILLAFVMITAVMIVLLNPGKGIGKLHPANLGKGTAAGFVSMLPNLFPVVVIFGAMGYLALMVDIGSMMTASVAMGVAVDDTIHFLTWFRKSLRQGYERKAAIKHAYGRVAMAMTQTTAIGGLGLFVFFFSTFTPTQQFGGLMLALLLAALVGDLIFLPALLASPLGRFFEVPPEDDDDPPPPEEEESSGEVTGKAGDSIPETVPPDENVDESALPHGRKARLRRQDPSHRFGK